MNKICMIYPHHAGFGQYQRSHTIQISEEFESASEYASSAIADSEGWFTDYVADDERPEPIDVAERKEMIDALDRAKNAVLGGHGTLIAFIRKNGEIHLESFERDN